MVGPRTEIESIANLRDDRRVGLTAGERLVVNGPGRKIAYGQAKVRG